MAENLADRPSVVPAAAPPAPAVLPPPSIRCAQCDQQAVARISYLSSTGDRRGWQFCREHGRAFWDTLSAPLRETAEIDPV